MNLHPWIQIISHLIEAAGVLSLIIGGIASTIFYFRSLSRHNPKAYQNYRGSLGRAILLSLELLVAGDIIGTVAVQPTFESLGVLALIVLIRTFLSFSLEVEIKGHWPWKAEAEKA